jgi:hypothetical protein
MLTIKIQRGAIIKKEGKREYHTKEIMMRTIRKRKGPITKKIEKKGYITKEIMMRTTRKIKGTITKKIEKIGYYTKGNTMKLTKTARKNIENLRPITRNTTWSKYSKNVTFLTSNPTLKAGADGIIIAPLMTIAGKKLKSNAQHVMTNYSKSNAKEEPGNMNSTASIA